MGLVVADVVIEARAEDFDFAFVDFAHAGFCTKDHVADFIVVKSHKFRGHAVDGEPVGSCEGDFVVNGGSGDGAVVFHALESVEYGELGCNAFCQGEHIEVDTLVFRAAMDEVFVGGSFAVGSPSISGVFYDGASGDVFESEGDDGAVVCFHGCGGDEVDVGVENQF